MEAIGLGVVLGTICPRFGRRAGAPAQMCQYFIFFRCLCILDMFFKNDYLLRIGPPEEAGRGLSESISTRQHEHGTVLRGFVGGRGPGNQ